MNYILLTNSTSIDFTKEIGPTINIVNDYGVSKKLLLDNIVLLKTYIAGTMSLTSIEYQKLEYLKKYIESLY